METKKEWTTPELEVRTVEEITEAFIGGTNDGGDGFS